VWKGKNGGFQKRWRHEKIYACMHADEQIYACMHADEQIYACMHADVTNRFMHALISAETHEFQASDCNDSKLPAVDGRKNLIWTQNVSSVLEKMETELSRNVLVWTGLTANQLELKLSLN